MLGSTVFEFLKNINYLKIRINKNNFVKDLPENCINKDGFLKKSKNKNKFHLMPKMKTSF